MDVNLWLGGAVDAVCEEGGAHSAALPAVRLVTDDAHAEVHLAGMRARAGGNRVKPWLEFFQHRNQLFGIGEIRRVIDDEINELAAAAKGIPSGLVIRLHQGSEKR